MPTLFPPEYPDRPDAPLFGFGPSFAEEISRSLIAAVWFENLSQPHENDVRVAAALTMLEGFHPRSHLECMLAAQGVAAHAMIMDCFRRAMDPSTPEPLAIKIRGSIAQLSRTFSTILRDLERLQTKPLPRRPRAEGQSTSEPPPSDPSGSGSPPFSPPPFESPSRPSPRKTISQTAEVSSGSVAEDVAVPVSSPSDSPPDVGSDTSLVGKSRSVISADGLTGLLEMAAEPDDLLVRPDGTPGSLAAYAPKPPEDVYVPGEDTLTWALSTRPKLWRQVNGPPGKTAEAELLPDPQPVQTSGRGPLDLREAIYSGDALSRFASARFDPNAPIEPLNFDDEYSEVDLELISTGGDPELEAERKALIAAHPEGKAIKTIRYGGTPPEKPPEDE